MIDRQRALPRPLHFLVFALVACVMNGAGTARVAAAETLWELLPYRVKVLVALSPQAEACAGIEGDLVTALETRAETIVGPRWQLSAVMAPPALREEMLAALDTVDTKQILPALGDEDVDKAFLVRINFADGVFLVETRDFDVRAQMGNAAVSQRVYHRARLGEALFQTLLSAFAPLAIVETVDGEKVTLRLRGAAIPTRQPVLALPEGGSVYRVAVRTNDAAGKARRVIPIDWTYLVEQSIEGSLASAKLVTGLRAPLSPKRRRRIEQLALLLHLPTGPTTLQLRSTDKTPHPLVGYQVYSHPVDSKETELLGSTDSTGAVQIEPGDGGVRVLLVKSGGAIVARLPLVPGLAETALAQLPDDQRRLEVEGLITGFQEELVDLIARRQVLMTRIRSRMRAGKTEEAKQLLTELRRLRSQQDLSRQLLVERQRRTSDDPRTQRQIDKMFDDTQTVISRYLDGRSIDRLEREVNGDVTAQAAAAADDGT